MWKVSLRDEDKKEKMSSLTPRLPMLPLQEIDVDHDYQLAPVRCACAMDDHKGDRGRL